MTTIRGAITIENNDAREIVDATRRLLEEIMHKNSLQIDDILFIIFTATNDLDAAYPAVAAREMGITDASLMCAQEMYVEGSLRKCIRVMAAISGGKPQKDVSHCYMENAAALRPDLLTKQFKAIAVDGPVASGKSTVAKKVAEGFGFVHVETGAFYRAVALYCTSNGIEDESAIIDALDKLQLTVSFEDGVQRTFLDGEDVTASLRSPEISAMSSRVAGIAEVRDKLLPFIRDIAGKYDVVMDGRDIQTVVLPDACVKIFITASVDERAKRRCIDLEKSGCESHFSTVKAQIMERDCADSGRACAPLLKADDAIEIDTTELTLAETVDKLTSMIGEALGGQGVL